MDGKYNVVCIKSFSVGEGILQERKSTLFENEYDLRSLFQPNNSQCTIKDLQHDLCRKIISFQKKKFTLTYEF